MPSKVFSVKPVLKTGEYADDRSDSAYIYFDEEVDIPGVGRSIIRIDFDKTKSFEKVDEIKRSLKDAGFTLTIHKA